MEKYQRGKIYAIICRKTGRRYIGSTCEPTLAKRLSQHVKEFKKWNKNKSRFVSSYDIIKEGDYYIILLELYPCGSKDELRMCEQKHIDLNECVNKCKAFITEEERVEYDKIYAQINYEENKEELIEKAKENYKKNKDIIVIRKKKHYEANREYYKKKAIEYYKKNKEQIAEKSKEKYQKNKEKIKQKYDCPCGY